MKYIKILGLKNFLLYEFLHYTEFLLNSPYIIIKSIIRILYTIFDMLDDLFSQERIIKLRKIKKIDNFYSKCQNKARKEDRIWKVK